MVATVKCGKYYFSSTGSPYFSYAGAFYNSKRFFFSKFLAKAFNCFKLMWFLICGYLLILYSYAVNYLEGAQNLRALESSLSHLRTLYRQISALIANILEFG